MCEFFCDFTVYRFQRALCSVLRRNDSHFAVIEGKKKRCVELWCRAEKVEHNLFWNFVWPNCFKWHAFQQSFAVFASSTVNRQANLQYAIVRLTEFLLVCHFCEQLLY